MVLQQNSCLSSELDGKLTCTCRAKDKGKYFIATKNKGNQNIQNIQILYYYCRACLHMAWNQVAGNKRKLMHALKRLKLEYFIAKKKNQNSQHILWLLSKSHLCDEELRPEVNNMSWRHHQSLCNLLPQQLLFLDALGISWWTNLDLWIQVFAALEDLTWRASCIPWSSHLVGNHKWWA